MNRPVAAPSKNEPSTPKEWKIHEGLKVRAAREYAELLRLVAEGAVEKDDPLVQEKLRDLESCRVGWGFLVVRPARRQA